MTYWHLHLLGHIHFRSHTGNKVGISSDYVKWGMADAYFNR